MIIMYARAVKISSKLVLREELGTNFIKYAAINLDKLRTSIIKSYKQAMQLYGRGNKATLTGFADAYLAGIL